MKKVLFLITKSNFGGAQRYVFDLATRLPKDRFDVVVAFGGHGELKKRLMDAGIKTLQIRGLQRDMNIFKDIRASLSIIKLYREEKPDIVHINSSKIGGIGAFIARIMSVEKIIFTGHGWAFNEDRNMLSKGLIFLLHALTIMLTHHTIAVSNETKTQITNRAKFLSKKISVIHNGIDSIEYLEPTLARDEVLKMSGGLNKDSLWLGSVGELHHIKGHSYLIDVIAELDESNMLGNLQLIIMGEGEERNNLAKKIKAYGLSKRIFLAGNVKDACKYMKAFDIFIFPSLSEAFPYTILEAGLAGLPIIASRVGGIPEAITDGVSGDLVKAKDVSAIKSKLLKLMNDKEKSLMYGANMRADVEKKFSKKQTTEKTMNVYNLKL